MAATYTVVQWKRIMKNSLTVNFCYSDHFHVTQYMFSCDTLAGYGEFLI